MPQKYVATFWLTTFLLQAPMLISYLSGLSHIRIYGWLAWIWPLMLSMLLVLRWDRRPAVPDSWLGVMTLVGGLVMAALGLLMRYDWLAFMGFCLCSSVFLASHLDSQGRNLLTLLPMLLAILRPPFGSLAWVQEYSEQFVLELSMRLLRLADIPFMQFASTIALPSKRIYPADGLTGLLGWPMFVGLAMLHCALLRRRWPVVVANLIFAYFLCLVFHIGLVFSLAKVNQMASASLLPQLWIGIGWGIMCYLLFLSSERGIRGAFSPIADGPDDSREANPIIAAWNWCMQPVRAAAREIPASLNRFVFPVLAALLLAIIVGNFIRIPSLFAGVAPSPLNIRPTAALVSAVWDDADNTDYRMRESITHPTWGTAASIWTHYAPGHMTEFVVTHSPQHWQDLEIQYLVQGWQATQAERPTDRLTSSIVKIPLQREGKFALLQFAAIDHQAKPLEIQQAKDTGHCLMVQHFTVFLRPPLADTLAAMETEFSSLLDRLQNTRAP